MTCIELIGSTESFRSAVTSAFEGGAPVDIHNVDMNQFDQVLVDSVLADNPDLVVIGPDMEEAVSVKLIESISRAAPHLSTILIANPTPELWPLALRAGVRDIIRPLADQTGIRESFNHAIETGRRLRRTAVSPDAAPNKARVFTVISPKGGSGKTTVASNLAVTIAKGNPGEVVLVDLDVQFGDISYAFRLDPEYSLLNAVAPGVTPTVLKGFLSPHKSKVLALTAPDRPEDADDIDIESTTKVVRDLSSLFGYLVIDTPAGLDDRTLAILEVTTDVVLVTATDVPSVRAVVKELDILGRLGLIQNTTNHLVLNRADARVELSVGDIEKTIGLSANLSIPSTRAIPTALNLGEPIVSAEPHSVVARGFNNFAEEVGVLATGMETGWRWRRGR